MRQTRAVVILAVTLGTSVFAAAPQKNSKAAWEWTLEERIAARFDEQREARRATHSARADDTLSGHQSPALLFPTEIFTIFMTAAYTQAEDDVAREVRRDALNKACALGLPKDFLNVLEAESAGFIGLAKREWELTERMAKVSGPEVLTLFDEIKKLREEQCAPRAEALRRLRERYGNTFDRFLYEAIAPGVFTSVSSDRHDADYFRRQEGGCQ